MTWHIDGGTFVPHVLTVSTSLMSELVKVKNMNHNDKVWLTCWINKADIDCTRNVCRISSNNAHGFKHYNVTMVSTIFWRFLNLVIWILAVLFHDLNIFLFIAIDNSRDPTIPNVIIPSSLKVRIQKLYQESYISHFFAEKWLTCMFTDKVLIDACPFVNFGNWFDSKHNWSSDFVHSQRLGVWVKFLGDIISDVENL